MPETPPDKSERSEQRRDAYDKANTLVLSLTLIAAGMAAYFTAQQASIARDQEHRALRAYIVVTGQLITDKDGQSVFAQLTYENMGQTPVYDLFFDGVPAVLTQGEEMPFKSSLSYDCKSNPEGMIHTRGRTFSKMASERMGLSISNAGNPSTFSEIFSATDRSAYVYGTVCYRDIFRAIHSIRVCFRWVSKDYGPDSCLESGQENEDY